MPQPNQTMTRTPFQNRVLGFGSALLLLAVATSPFWTVMIIKRHADRVVNDALPSLISSNLVSVSIAEAFLETSLAIATRDVASRNANLLRIDEQSKKTDSELIAYAALISDPKVQQYYERLVGDRRVYRATRDAVVDLLNQGKHDEAVRLFHAKGLEQFKTYAAALNHLVEYNITEARQRGRQIQRWCNFLLIAQGLLLVYFFVYGFFVPLLAVLERLTTRRRIVRDV